MEQSYTGSLITNQKVILEEVFKRFFPNSQNLYFLVGYFYFSGFENLYKGLEIQKP
jgi:hypothetical protein